MRTLGQAKCNIINQTITIGKKRKKERKKVRKKERKKTRPAWAGFKTAEEGIAIIMSYIL